MQAITDMDYRPEFDSEQNKKNPLPQVTAGNWFFTILITMIPIVNIVFLLYWTFSEKANPAKKSWAVAMLIWVMIFSLAAVFLTSYIFNLLNESAMNS